MDTRKVSEKCNVAMFVVAVKHNTIYVSVEKLPDEILDAFLAFDTKKTGKINARVLRNILANWGEQLTEREISAIFREANINQNGGDINYHEFLKIVSAPVPDYY